MTGDGEGCEDYVVIPAEAGIQRVVDWDAYMIG
jgi:hypothetical protein